MSPVNIPYGKQEITPEDILRVTECLQSDFLTQGPKVKEFEDRFAAYVGARYAVAVANGTAALHLSAMALGVNETSHVITTPITFAASANCVRYCGGQVHFADIDPQTFLLDIEKVKALIESKPKGFFSGIIPVDFAGNAVNLEAFRQLADEHGLWILEDACHAPGGYFTDSKGQKQLCGNGKFAELAIFSFHPVKHIACGEGGMITTDNEELYQKLLTLRTHGITKDPALMEENHGGWYMEMQTLGYNYRMPDMLCALGISQLERADGGLKRRKEIADRYSAGLQNLPLTLPVYDEGHAFHLYVVQTTRRKELYDYLRTQHIFCQVHYIPVYRHPYYRALGHQKGEQPQSETYYEGCLSLPMFPSLKPEEQDLVIDRIKAFLA